MTIDQLRAETERLSKGYPEAKLPLPRLLSKRPVFRG
jgi:hypothetical protein